MHSHFLPLPTLKHVIIIRLFYLNEGGHLYIFRVLILPCQKVSEAGGLGNYRSDLEPSLFWETKREWASTSYKPHYQ